MSDFNVGDTVIVNNTSGWLSTRYKFDKATVKKITPKQVQVDEYRTRFYKDLVYPFTAERWQKLRDLMDSNVEMLARHESEKRWMSEAIKNALADEAQS